MNISLVKLSKDYKEHLTDMMDEWCKKGEKIGINRGLMVCDKDNIGSAKSIMNNGGILENEVLVDGIIQQRYWIEMEMNMLYQVAM